MPISIHRALVAIVSICNLRVIFYKSHTDIFDVVYKGNWPSFQCKKSLGRFASMGELDGLILILIDPYVSMLTPRFH